jgi:hypothetical protein
MKRLSISWYVLGRERWSFSNTEWFLNLNVWIGDFDLFQNWFNSLQKLK